MANVSWIKVRKPISKYPKTHQQHKIKVAGQLIREVCKGKKAEDFLDCRTTVLQCAFDDDKCSSEHYELKKKLKEEEEH